jgi:SPOR domain
VRNALLALLFVNLVYFAWAHWIDVPQPAPVNEAVAKLPALKLVEEVPPAERPQPEAPKAAPVPTACLSVGPFGDLDNSAHAAALLKAKGFDPRQRAEPGQLSDSYWVYVQGFKSQADTDRALVTLERAGIKDALVMPETAEAGKRLSLGLYSERARAEKRAQAVRVTGLDAQVADHKMPSSLYWVDLTPPPGMNTVPIEDLFAEGVSSRISVQPCPASPLPAPATAPGTVAVAAAAPGQGAATPPAAPPVSPTASAPPAVAAK